MKKVKTCIVIADGSRARIFLNEGPGKGLKQLDHDGYLEQPHKETTDNFGIEHPVRGIGHGPETLDPNLLAKRLFAKQVADVINLKAANNEFERIVLVAPAKTLGDLKKKLAKNAANMIKSSISKDFTHVKASDLPKHLKDIMVL